MLFLTIFLLTCLEKRCKEKREIKKQGKLLKGRWKLKINITPFNYWKPLKSVLGVPKCKFLLWQSISWWEKIWKMTLPPLKNSPLVEIRSLAVVVLIYELCPDSIFSGFHFKSVSIKAYSLISYRGTLKIFKIWLLTF